jgi:hypothetical protein
MPDFHHHSRDVLHLVNCATQSPPVPNRQSTDTTSFTLSPNKGIILATFPKFSHLTCVKLL